jgi:N-acetylmuramidase
MPNVLTYADFEAAAAQLRCSVASVRAVASVEGSGKGFNKNGIVLSRFEPHLFKRYTGIAASTYGQAFALNPLEANRATSWGMFQVLGLNYKAAGYNSIDEMIADYRKGERQQLASFVRLIVAWGLDDEMRNQQWAAFAKRYNGPQYAVNQYDIKMAKAYESYKNNPSKGLDTGSNTTANIVITIAVIAVAVGSFFF